MAKNVSRRLKERNRKIFYYAMMALPLLQFFIFYICVNINSVVLAFKQYSVTEGEKFVYFDNFSDVINGLFNEPMLTQSFINSLKVWGATLLIGTTLALVFSYYIYKKCFGNGLFRVILFLPQIISSIVLIVVFRYFLTEFVPALMKPWDVKVPDFLDETKTAWTTVLIYALWTGFGTSTMMYVGAMNNISDSIVEYAKLDGFSPLQEFVHITLPMIYPTLVTFITVGLAGLFTNQMNLYQFFGGSAEPQLYTVGYYMYVKIQSAGRADYPFLAAFGLVMTFISAPLTLIVKKLLEKYGPRVD